MAEVIVTVLAVAWGLFRSTRSLRRLSLLRRALREDGFGPRSPEVVLANNKRWAAWLVLVGQVVMAGVLVLITVYESPRPPTIQTVVRWSIVFMPVVLALLSDHAERSYDREKEALDLAINGNNKEQQ